MLLRRAARLVRLLAASGPASPPPRWPAMAPASVPLPPPPPLARRWLCSGGGQRLCWKCRRPASESGHPPPLFCGECGAVQPLDASVGHYDLLLCGGSAPTYRVDAGQLATAMRRLQWQLHPDKFANASEEERNLAQQQSAKVNSAYHCLSDPVRRAVYLLGLRGVAMPTEETGSGRRPDGEGETGSGDLSLPQEFLAEMLELNEALMEADRATIGQLSDRVDSDTRALTAELAGAFDSGDLRLAKELTYRLKYFANIRAKIKEMA